MSLEAKWSAVEQINKLLFNWIDISYKSALAGAKNEDEKQAIESMRWLELDDYHYTVSPRIAELFIEEDTNEHA